MTVVLGLSNTHNGSVAVICDGKIRSAIQAERISRIKRQALPLGKEKSLVKNCVDYCLEASGLTHKNIDAVALCTPWTARTITDAQLFDYIGGYIQDYGTTFYVPHHFSHMEYIVHFGNLEPGIVLVIDGSGSFEQDRKIFNIEEKFHDDITNLSHFVGKEVISAYWFDGCESYLIYRFSPSVAPSESYNLLSDGLLQSIGHYWEWASQYCCGTRQEAGKVMGLAAFGDPPTLKEDNLLKLTDNGEIRLDFKGLREKYTTPNIFGLDLSNSGHHQQLALRVQRETENIILKLLKSLKRKFPTDTLYFSGGVSLNVVANEKIIKSNLFKNVVLNGSVEDNGSAIGAALAGYHELGHSRRAEKALDYFGKQYGCEEIIEASKSFKFPYKAYPKASLYKHAAELIAENNVIGWFQGRSEFGPRALGNRSILANPIFSGTKYALDFYMKCRDRYRPYAPVIIEEKASQYFDIMGTSPTMMRNVTVLTEKLPAITHVDGSARLQTVNREDNEPLYLLLLEVEKTIGCPILLNTSFNLPGEPIVETPFDALSSFARGGLDYLIMGNVLISR